MAVIIDNRWHRFYDSDFRSVAIIRATIAPHCSSAIQQQSPHEEPPYKRIDNIEITIQDTHEIVGVRISSRCCPARQPKKERGGEGELDF